MESRDRYPAVCIDRRHILGVLSVPFLAACAGGLGTKPQDPIAKAAPFIKKDIAWKIGDFLDFLAALPPSGLLALKKTLELLPDRSGPANLNNFLGGNSGHKVLAILVRQTGVSDGQEISTTHTSYPHTGVQGPRGPCRIA